MDMMDSSLCDDASVILTLGPLHFLQESLFSSKLLSLLNLLSLFPAIDFSGI